MKTKQSRLETLKMIISSQEMSCQEDLLKALRAEGYTLTQATLSRDLKQLKVAKAATMSGSYVYVLPNVSMYRRVQSPQRIQEMMKVPGFVSINFSGNMAVIKTRLGYASSIAYSIDMYGIPLILGSISGADTIFLVLREGADHDDVITALSKVVPNLNS